MVYSDRLSARFASKSTAELVFLTEALFFLRFDILRVFKLGDLAFFTRTMKMDAIKNETKQTIGPQKVKLSSERLDLDRELLLILSMSSVPIFSNNPSIFRLPYELALLPRTLRGPMFTPPDSKLFS